LGDGNRLAGLTVLVTGASRGIGEAVARACAAAGAALALTARDAARLEAIAADLALTARDSSGLDAIAADLRASGRKAESFPADARDEAAVAAVVDAARSRLGPLDAAVLNQGINRIVPIADMTAAQWHEVLDTNLTASFLFARALARENPPPATIVLVSSVSGLPGHLKFPGFAAYCAAKRGLLGLAEVLAVELADRGTRVYAVCPRGVDTEMFRQTFPDAEAHLTADQVAAKILDLLDPATAPPTGAVIEI